MASARSILASAATTCALVLASAGASSAGEPAGVTDDRVIYAQAEALWSIPSAGGEATVLAPLPLPAKSVSRIKVAASGTAMLVSVGGYQAWAALSPDAAGPVDLHFLPCGGGLSTSPDISPDGNRVLCATQAGKRIAIYQMRPGLDVEIVDRPADGPLFFATEGDRMVGFGDERTLVDLRTGDRLTPHRPGRSMAITADGKRALGSYNEGDIDVVYTFRLDGRATKRTLMQAARVVSISASSEWASLQQEVDGCAVRIAGGQYMCWRRHEAIDISSQARSLLLGRSGEKSGYDLFVGSISGTKARKPTPLVQGVERAAAFWPMPPPSVSPSAAEQTPAPATSDAQE